METKRQGFVSQARKRRRKKRKQKQILLLGLIAAGATAACILIGISIYYESHFFPNTTILGIDCSKMTAEQVNDALADRAACYLLTVVDRTGERYLVRGADISCRYLDAGAVEDLLAKQVGARFLIDGSKEKEYALSEEVAFDENALQSLVSGFSFMDPANMIAPEDAVFTITETGYELVPEVDGTTVIPEKVQQTIKEAVSRQEEQLTLPDACYENPSVTTESPEIAETREAMDHYMGAEITYQVEGKDLKLDSVGIAGMLAIDGTNVSIDEGKAHDFAQKLAYELNTFGRPREFQTARGGTVTIGGGDYGWVVDKDGETEQIIADLNGGTPVSREPVYEQTALHQGDDDIGDTYIEIDYTNQHLYYFKDGELQADTDIVSGNISKNNGSPDGVFKIVYKESPATLVGENYSSDVTYFMPFAYNVGIHDADWRSSFGGEIYKTSGSHGCVNVPKGAAEKLYGIVEKGTPVIAYYRTPVVLTAENARISNAYSYDKEAAESGETQNADAAAPALVPGVTVIPGVTDVPAAVPGADAAAAAVPGADALTAVPEMPAQ